MDSNEAPKLSQRACGAEWESPTVTLTKSIAPLSVTLLSSSALYLNVSRCAHRP